MRHALAGDGGSDVPCNGCTACCTSRQFVAIGSDELDTLAHVPAGLRFPAPGRPGQFVLGYDDEGRCPMLGLAGCSIYEHRPRACRVYDCRVFTASGVDPGQPEIAARARGWRFTVRTDADRAAGAAVEAASSFLADRLGVDDPTWRAVGAVTVADLFEGGAEPEATAVLDALRSRTGPA